MNGKGCQKLCSEPDQRAICPYQTDLQRMHCILSLSCCFYCEFNCKSAAWHSSPYSCPGPLIGHVWLWALKQNLCPRHSHFTCSLAGKTGFDAAAQPILA